MNTARFRATAIALTLVSVVAVAACANNDATTEGSSGTVTETKPTTPGEPVDLSEEAAKNRETPLPTDLGLLVPPPETLQEMSAASGGLYNATGDQVIPFDSANLPWATSMLSGFERSFEFQSVNEDDPMKTHAATMEIRALVFNSPEDASAAMGEYQRSRGRAVTQADIVDGTRLAALRYDVTSAALGRFSEGLSQRGSVLTWVVFADNVSMSWEQPAVAMAQAYLSNVLERYPSLAQ